MCTLNLYNVINQLYFNKAGGKNKKTTMLSSRLGRIMVFIHSVSECLHCAGTVLGGKEAAIMQIQQALDFVELITQWRKTNSTYINPGNTFR